MAAASASTIPWVEKYRPATLKDVIAQQDIVGTIERLCNEQNLPNLLFYGPAGTGKTSTILAVARKLFGPNFKNMVLELNASDDRKIETVREEIKNFASTRSIFSSGFKLVILDEADAMRNEAQFALRRVIEKFTANTRFCLICNYVGNIIPALQSRCTKFRFGPLGQHLIRDRLNYIIQQEKVTVTEDGLVAIERLAQGDMRRCLNILQSCGMAFSTVDERAVYLCTGSPLPADIEAMLDTMMNDSFDVSFKFVNDLSTNNGYAVVDLVRESHLYLPKMDLPPSILIPLLEGLADVEFRLTGGGNDRVQLAAFVGLFQIARNQALAEAKNAERTAAMAD